jgi:hypothetical protein
MNGATITLNHVPPGLHRSLKELAITQALLESRGDPLLGRSFDIVRQGATELEVFS